MIVLIINLLSSEQKKNYLLAPPLPYPEDKIALLFLFSSREKSKLNFL